MRIEVFTSTCLHLWETAPLAIPFSQPPRWRTIRSSASAQQYQPARSTQQGRRKMTFPFNSVCHLLLCAVADDTSKLTSFAL